jgi:hypothetical protein
MPIARWLLLLLVVALACPATQSGSTRSRSSDDESEEKEGDADKESSPKDDEDSDDGGKVRISHKTLPDAVVETSSNGRPRKDLNKMRRIICEGHEDAPKIFYHVIVSTHWHYYWLCSDNQTHRVSTKTGAQSLRKWIKGFQREAGVMSRDCPQGSSKKHLTGTHESGIHAIAFCDGRITLTYPDGEKKTIRFSSQASETPDATGGDDGDSRSPEPTPPSVGRCPPCPAAKARPCPECPPPPACPPPKECPVCDCRNKELAAGQKGFKQGIDKACAKICQLIYQKCRSINPNTALCYQVSEFCAASCGK